MTAPFSIMCFSWNASGLRLCETMSQTKADQSRKGVKAFVTRKQPCVAPDFFENIRTTIREKTPALVVMVTEDEDNSDTYFHSDLLPSAMGEIGYGLLKRDKLDGVGKVPSKVPQIRVPTGDPKGSALRMSIYSINEMLPAFQSEEKIIRKFFSNNGQVGSKCQTGDRISGAIAAYVWHETFGKFAFIATNLPSGSDSLKVGKSLDYTSYRVASKSANNLCLIKMLNKFVDSLPKESKPDHVFMLGDFNYDIVVPNKQNYEVVSDLAANLTASKFKELQNFDELSLALKEQPLLGFKEGPGGNGPLFMPTWRLSRARPQTCSPNENTTSVDIACFGSPNDPLGGIGWHDRILYKDLMSSYYVTHCLSYNRFDVLNTTSSTNAGVVALFELHTMS